MESAGAVRKRFNPRVVLTGPPCSGKTTTAYALADQGFTVVPEIARELVRQATGGELYVAHERDQPISNRLADIIAERQLQLEENLLPSVPYVFDRALPDCVAFREHHGFALGPLTGVDLRDRYDLVVLFSALPFVEDEVRDRSDVDAREMLAIRIRAIYEALGYPIVHLDVAPVRTLVSDIISELDARFSFRAV